MRLERLWCLAPILAAAVLIAACGQTGDHRSSLTVGGVPLAGGAHVVARARSCDRGANPYCSLQMVIVAGAGVRDATQLLAREQARLRERGWTSTVGDTPKERSADSPGGKLRLSYALAADDLLSFDQGQIKRRPGIARALARAMFERAPALSLMLQTGSS
jgi:hypothetical protein